MPATEPVVFEDDDEAVPEICPVVLDSVAVAGVTEDVLPVVLGDTLDVDGELDRVLVVGVLVVGVLVV